MGEIFNNRKSFQQQGKPSECIGTPTNSIRNHLTVRGNISTVGETRQIWNLFFSLLITKLLSSTLNFLNFIGEVGNFLGHVGNLMGHVGNFMGQVGNPLGQTGNPMGEDGTLMGLIFKI